MPVEKMRQTNQALSQRLLHYYMDRNELLGGGSQKADFSGAIYDQTSGQTGYQQVPNERYGHDLSTDTP